MTIVGSPRVSRPTHARRRGDLTAASALLVVAALGWWWSVRMALEMQSMGSGSPAGGMSMSMSMPAFVVGWAAMMAAMMLPAIWPTVRFYARAAGGGSLAPVPVFASGYLVAWGLTGIPAFFAWRALASPLATGVPWAGRVAGATLLGAAAYQLSPFKGACLRYCRSPLSFVLRIGNHRATPARSLWAGAVHGAFCFGCCWGLMAVMVAVGTMDLAWMGALTVLIAVEKAAPRGDVVALASAPILAATGIVLVVHPGAITGLTS